MALMKSTPPPGRIVMFGLFLGFILIGSTLGQYVYPVYPDCSNDIDCDGSACNDETGKCMNPFYDQGCLRTMINRCNETHLKESESR